MRFLPNVVVYGGDYAGKITGGTALGNLIPVNTPVGAGLADFQCSVLSTLHRSDQAILNISTSAQLAFVMRDGFEPKKQPEVGEESLGHVEYFPYFQV
jgi:sedoheptulokinase